MVKEYSLFIRIFIRYLIDVRSKIEYRIFDGGADFRIFDNPSPYLVSSSRLLLPFSSSLLRELLSSSLRLELSSSRLRELLRRRSDGLVGMSFKS